MNRFFRLFAAAAIVATAAGCAPEDPENGQQGNTDTQDTLSAPELTATASEGALTFTWTSGTIENSELEVDYTLYVGKAGEDLFENGVSFEVDGLTYTINGEDYTALLNDMGCQSGATLDMIAAVTATAGDETKTSAQKSFTAGLPEAEVVFPEALYMKGGACPGEWTTATVLEKTEEGVYEATEVTLMFGKPVDGKGFKFFVSEEPYPFYGQDNTEGAAFGDIKVFATENDGDSQFYPLQHEYVSAVYTVNVNLNTMKLTLTKTEDVYEPQIPFYVFGEGLDYDWEMNEALKLDEIEPNVFEGYNIHLYKTSSFKFDNADWTEYQRDETASEYWTVKAKVEGEDFRFIPGEGDENFADGKYTVRLDLNTMKVTLTLTEAEQPEVTYVYLSGAAFADYTDWKDWISVPSVAENVYETTLNLNVGDASYARGFKIYKAKDDWANEYCMYSDSTQDNIKFGHKNDTGDNQVIPFNVGYTESGNYVVRIDFNTMKVTFTKVN